MTDVRERNFSRRQLLQAAGAAAAAATAGLAHPGAAAAGPKTIPVTAVAKGPGFVPFVIPWDPPVWGVHLTLSGQSDALGPFTYLENSTIQLDVEGAPIAVTEAMGALVGASGDALFFRFNGLVQLTAAGVACNHALVILGGKGKFAGATGSGSLTGEGNATKNESVITINAMISLP